MKLPFVLTVWFLVYIFAALAIPANGQSTDLEVYVDLLDSTHFNLNWTYATCTSPWFEVNLLSAIPNHFVSSSCPTEEARSLINETSMTYSYNNSYADYSYAIDVEAFCNGSLNGIGFANFSTPVAAPGQPNISGITQFLDRQQNLIFANLSWSMPCKPNGNLSEYEIMLYHMNKTTGVRESVNLFVPATDKIEYSYQLPDLMPRTDYAAVVKAIGTLEGDDSVDKPFTTGDLLPPTPIISVVNATSASFTIVWNVTKEYPEQVQDYSITITPLGPLYDYNLSFCAFNDSSIAVTVADNQTSFTYTSAKAYYNYTVRVAADNSEGRADSESMQTFTESGVPPPPVNLSLTDSTLFWNPPCELNGPPAFFNITVFGEYTENNNVTDSWNWPLNYTNGVYAYTTNLTLHYSYNYIINVTIVLENGLFGEPAVIVETTPPGIPGPPVVTITDLRAMSFNVTWTEPEEPVGPIFGYNMTIIPFGRHYDSPANCTPVEQTVMQEFNQTIKSYYFDQAKPYSTYQVILSASTDAGNGSLQFVNVTTETYTPEAPLNLTSSHFTGLQYDISWEVPCNVYGPVSHFNISYFGYYTEDANNNISDIRNYKVNFTENLYKYHKSDELLESYVYRVEVFIVLNDGTNGLIATIENITTEPGIPGLPVNISINSDMLNSTPSITWLPPLEKKGKIISYDVEVVALYPLYLTNQNCSMPKNISVFNSTVDNSIILFLNLYNYYNYSISVRANTLKGAGGYSTFFCTSIEGTPDQVEVSNEPTFSVQPTESYNATAIIHFSQPCFLNGILVNYTLTYYNDMEIYSIGTTTSSFIFPLATPETTYTYYIQTFNRRNVSNIMYRSFQSPAGVPKMRIASNNLTMNVGDSEVSVVLKKDYFAGPNISIKYVALILAEHNINGSQIEGYEPGTWPNITNGDAGMYQLTPDMWSPFTESDTVTFVIGDGSNDCSDAQLQCNKPLQPDRDYFLLVRAYTNTFYRNSPTIYFKTNNVTDVGVIVGILLGILVPACLGFIIFLIWRRRMIRLPGVLYIKSSSSTKHTPIINTSVPVKKFIQYCKFLENNPEKMKEQYLLLGEKSKEASLPKTTTFAQLPENKRKNRYVNILPFDETRVKLLIDEDDDLGTDYINASYIKGYTGQVEYIATQGPLETSSRDFWKMILQENVSIIVMVSQFIENDKIKCFRYFPKNRDTMYIEDIEIRCTMELHFGIYCIRMLQVRKDTVQTNVIHMQFLEWPDFGVPSGTEHMLQFCYQLRQRIKMEGGYVVIHCSAGVGRTGTLIATDILLQAVNAKKNIDVFNTVLELRQQRINMVQTEKQYMYIHSLVRDHIDRPPTPDFIDTASPIYENVSVLSEDKKDNQKNSSTKKLKSEEESTF